MFVGIVGWMGDPVKSVCIASHAREDSYFKRGVANNVGKSRPSYGNHIELQRAQAVMIQSGPVERLLKANASRVNLSFALLVRFSFWIHTSSARYLNS